MRQGTRKGRAPGIGAVAALALVLAACAPGSPDPSWGNGGTTITNLGQFSDRPQGYAWGPDGKLLVLADASTGFVARYTTSGALDTTYGNSGTKVIPHYCCDRGAPPRGPWDAIAAQPDGAVLVAAGRYSAFRNGVPDPAGVLEIARVDANGSSDTSFATTGLATRFTPSAVDQPTTVDAPLAIRVQADGSIVVAGETSTYQADNRRVEEGLFFHHLTPDGSPDTRFGVDRDGMVRRPYADLAGLDSIVFQDDDHILAAGVTAGSMQVFVRRFRASDGAVLGPGPALFDPSFGKLGGGRLALALQSDGGAVLVGTAQLNPSAELDVALTRVDIDGAQDPAFNRGAIQRATTAHVGMGAAVQSDGKILVAANQTPDAKQPTGMVVLRFNADGTADTSFGHGTGATAISFAGTPAFVSSTAYLVTSSENRVIALGEIQLDGPHATPPENFADLAVVGLQR